MNLYMVFALTLMVGSGVSQSTKQYYCGRRLVRELISLCSEFNYNAELAIKPVTENKLAVSSVTVPVKNNELEARSAAVPKDSKLEDSNVSLPEQRHELEIRSDTFPVEENELEVSKANILRRKRSIIDDCCFNPCGVEDMLSYC